MKTILVLLVSIALIGCGRITDAEALAKIKACHDAGYDYWAFRGLDNTSYRDVTCDYNKPLKDKK